MSRLGNNLWEILKGLGLAILCNLGLLIVAGLCALPSLDSTTPTFLGKLGETLVEWIGILQLAYLGPLIWGRWQTKRAMALGLLMGLFLVGFLNYWIRYYNQIREAEKPHFNYEYIYRAPEGDIRLTYSSFKKQGTGPTGGLEELFKPGPQTGVDLSQAQYFTFAFLRAPYVREYRFKLSMPTAPQTGDLKPAFGFSATGNLDEVNSYDYTRFPLTVPQATVTVQGEGHFFGVLRNSWIQLDLKRIDPKRSYEDYRESPVYLTGLQVIYSDRPVVKPTLTIQEIESKYVKGRKNWSFDGWFADDKDPLKEEHLKVEGEVLRSLMVQGLEGNKRAEKIFYNYRLKGTADSEWFSGLLSWYGQTKKDKGP